MTNVPILLAIADDQIIVRKGIISLLSTFADVSIIAETGSGQELLDILSIMKRLPDVILLDIDMPGLTGFSTAIAIEKQYPSCKVIALASFDSEYQLLRMIKCGARAYISKLEFSVEEMVAAIVSVHQTGYYFSSVTPSKLFDHAKEIIVPNITDKELHFLKLSLQGLSNKEIAAEMIISERSVEYYYTKLAEKMGVRNRICMIVFALKARFIDL